MSSTSSHERIAPSVWTSSTVSAALAVLLVVEIAGLGFYGYYRVQAVLDPESLANRAESAIRENYPEFRQELVQTIKTQAPELAEQVSREILASTPEAREQLERLTARQLKAGLREVTELSAEQFRSVLQENRETVVQAFEQLEKAPHEAERLILKTEASIDKQLGIDLQIQARQALAFHRNLNDKLERLSDPDAQLDGQELLERRIVRILKAMEEQDLSEERLARGEGRVP